jgi:hypothetical protein
MRILTVKRLEDLGACEDSVGDFRKIWGTQVEVTPEVFVPHAATFDWHWAADYLLSRKRSTQFQNEWREYMRDLRTKRDALRVEYQHDKFDTEEYNHKCNELTKERDAWEARKFAELYIADEGFPPVDESPAEDEDDDDEDIDDAVEVGSRG